MKIAANAEDAPEIVKEYYETVKGFDDYLAQVSTRSVGLHYLTQHTPTLHNLLTHHLTQLDNNPPAVSWIAHFCRKIVARRRRTPHV